VGETTRLRIGELYTATTLDPERIAWLLGLTPATVAGVAARGRLRRPEPDLAGLVAAVRTIPATQVARWDAVVACLWELVSLETRAQTGLDPGARPPAFGPRELKALVKGATDLEGAVARARAALAEREAAGEGPDGSGGDLAQIRAELARRVAAAHRAADHAGLASGDAGPGPGAAPA
jgi:hypothetical protein